MRSQCRRSSSARSNRRLRPTAAEEEHLVFRTSVSGLARIGMTLDSAANDDFNGEDSKTQAVSET